MRDYIVVALVVGAFLVAAYFGSTRPLSSNFGFDESWQCLPQAKGDPICFRKRQGAE